MADNRSDAQGEPAKTGGALVTLGWFLLVFLVVASVAIFGSSLWGGGLVKLRDKSQVAVTGYVLARGISAFMFTVLIFIADAIVRRKLRRPTASLGASDEAPK